MRLDLTPEARALAARHGFDRSSARPLKRYLQREPKPASTARSWPARPAKATIHVTARDGTLAVGIEPPVDATS